MSDYAREFLFLKSELENCRVKNPALEYLLWWRLKGWADTLIQNGTLPFLEHLL